LLAGHPELAADLVEFFADQDRLQHLAAPLRAVARAAAGEEELVARTLGDFRILREVGRGGMGVVYEAEQLSLRRRVALKVLPYAGMLDPRALQRFHNEAQAAACLHHTNIVPVYFVGSERGVHYYAMQFIDGQTLAALIQQQRQAAASVEKTTVYAPPDGVAAPTAETVVAAQPATRPNRPDNHSLRVTRPTEYPRDLGSRIRGLRPTPGISVGTPGARGSRGSGRYEGAKR